MALIKSSYDKVQELTKCHYANAMTLFNASPNHRPFCLFVRLLPVCVRVYVSCLHCICYCTQNSYFLIRLKTCATNRHPAAGIYY